jgi:hypothetical protein
MAKRMDYEMNARERNKPAKYKFQNVPEVLRQDIKTALAVGADDYYVLGLIHDVFLFCASEIRAPYEAELKLRSR